MTKYVVTAVSPDDFNRELDNLWAQLKTDPGLQQDAAAAGISVAKLPRGARRNLISVKYPANFDLVSGVWVTIVLAPVAKKILLDVWSKILLPRLERKFSITEAPKAAARSKSKKGR